VDAGSLYLRLFLGAKPFRSSELDSLAESMGVSDLLSGDEGERYFLAKSSVAALCLGNKILFGAGYYSSLTERQRLAVAAHEFGHVLGGGAERRKRLVAPVVAIPALLALAAFLGTGSAVALVSASVLGSITAVAVRSSSDSEHYLRHEMSCDRLAASFVDEEALVEAIRVAESRRGARRRRIASVWKRRGPSPSTKLRVDAILSRRGTP
jgi:Zn-dependent protease with chaperone function